MNYLRPLIICSILIFSLSACNEKTKLNAPLFNNLGDFHFSITTNSPQAQRYFDQGLMLVYGFDYAEAIRSFTAATKLDANCAMCYWGLALALGSKNNTLMNHHEKEDAFVAIQKAKQLAQSTTPAIEHALIAALAYRYAERNPKTMQSYGMQCHGNLVVAPTEMQAYANAMRKIVKQFPNEVDAKILYVAALFDVNNWNFWTRTGKPLPDTLEITHLLKTALAINPKHLGANHYYIHVIEQSPHPEQAITHANLLRDLMPNAEHLVHMPAHIYMRTGRYHDAVQANQAAIEIFKEYQALCHAQGFEPEINYLNQHNMHFLFAAAAIEGNKKISLNAAKQLRAQTPLTMVASDPNLQIFLAIPYFVNARFEQWHAIFKEPPPPEQYQYARGIWHYVRGIAYAYHKQFSLAEKEYAQLVNISQQERSQQNLRKSSMDKLEIAKQVLAATLAEKKGQINISLQHWKKAVQLQNATWYKEPSIWYFSTREGLGRVLLKTGQAAKAVLIYREDLAEHPDNGWALYGLAKSLRALGKNQEADVIDQRLKQAWKHADTSILTGW